ncbi:EF-Tu/IF-2/RF-3 family GTPase [Methanosalsum natronophilum]|uniref:EF-Tu/IF-2/RF-3 family GTPase n=1 Tax=Methanosalsum natronophilum TaxID=768733 RepID=UPI0021697337|nr:EF-Tu/IF-2/RF-3 family GTPase [Methanosalsum natronophilum]MCS3923934.1 selenocysteine-specific translation elongation factor [Methanosalsum natronophilum]
MAKIAIIGNQSSGKSTIATNLGKKTNSSDIVTYESKKNNDVITTIDPVGYPKSIKPLIVAIELSDIILICIPPEGPDSFTGECIVLLDLLKHDRGIFVLTKADTSYDYAQEQLKNKIKQIIKDTSLNNWEFINVSSETHEGMNELRDLISSLNKKVEIENRKLDEKEPRVIIDQCFNVTGIGCVALGIVKQGQIKLKDKLNVYPINKNVELRSIQVHDVNEQEASTGNRVGLALKNIQAKEIERGFILSKKENVSSEFSLNFYTSKFTKSVCIGDVLHVFNKLQTSPVRVKGIKVNGSEQNSLSPGSECILDITAEKEIAFTKSDMFILSNLDEKQRIVGVGQVV